MPDCHARLARDTKLRRLEVIKAWEGGEWDAVLQQGAPLRIRYSLARPGLGLATRDYTRFNSTHLQDVLQIAPSVHHLTTFLGRAVKREYLLSSCLNFLPSF